MDSNIHNVAKYEVKFWIGLDCVFFKFKGFFWYFLTHLVTEHVILTIPQIKMGIDMTNPNADWPNATVFVLDDKEKIRPAGQPQSYEISVGGDW